MTSLACESTPTSNPSSGKKAGLFPSFFVFISPSLRALAVRVVTAAYRKEGDSFLP